MRNNILQLTKYIDQFVKRPIKVMDHHPEDRRVGDLLADELKPDLKCAIIGFPVDRGVRINGGRVGAAEAADVIRACLYKMTPDFRKGDEHQDILQKTIDLGNLQVPMQLDLAQDHLGEVVKACFADGIFPIVLGGGHETAYGVFLGYVKAGFDMGIVNLDAHLDVRELKNGSGHSGSPFRQALEHSSGHCKSYSVLGCQPSSVSAMDCEFVKEHNGMVQWCENTTSEKYTNQLEKAGQKVMATFDMDVVDQSQAPGVSAPACTGIDKNDFLEAVYEAGCRISVMSFDLAEVCPKYDVDFHTSRLAANAVWTLLRGLATRESAVSQV